MKLKRQMVEKKLEAIKIAKGILNEEIDYISGNKMIYKILSEILESPHEEEMFHAFDAINSATDHLPTEDERGNWNKNSLKEKDDEAKKIYEVYEDDLIQGLEILIAKFS